MKVTSLASAIEAHVRPGAHLNFASTPSRSNAAIIALAHRFAGTEPGFTFSSTGFHSLAHVLGLLRLGSRYVGCFYGDNYPTPRPNPLYQRLRDAGVALEQWSLWSYVAALRAAAEGDPFVVCRGLWGTDVAEGLKRDGRYFEPEIAIPGQSPQKVGLLAALAPDITFLHAPVASASGLAWFSPPISEGFHGAMAARRGVILSADRLVSEEQIRARPHWMPLPAHRVLSVCEVPFGAHPQPLHVAEPSAVLPYRDDFEHYERWREYGKNPAAFAAFREAVLEADEPLRAYAEFVGRERLEALRVPHHRFTPNTEPSVSLEAPSPPRARPKPLPPAVPLTDLDRNERLIVLAARVLAERIAREEYRSLLAGIGQAFAAARLCRQLLGPNQELELMVETGFAGLVESEADPLEGFLLSQHNIARAERLSGIESVLGTLVRGSQNRCLGAVGAAEVDAEGNLNSTFAGGRLLVGSGGACDIAAGARETVVLARSDRLVRRVAHVTSPGRRVSTVVTDDGVLSRTEEGWAFAPLAPDAVPPNWPALSMGAPLAYHASPLELEFLRRLRDPGVRTEGRPGATAAATNTPATHEGN